MTDIRVPSNRRRFYLERATQKRPRGTGSDVDVLMAMPREELSMDIQPEF